ncbi:hypothetical protein [Candidatus Poriferisodalis sp.]|uniref:hypothetical protein n=1 Tax=Candidatus Poriferisodalis sp. TaxID=3101277 RepID=UPI003B025A15
MYEPQWSVSGETASIEFEIEGTLRIDGRCAYLDQGRDLQSDSDFMVRFVLSLPKGLTQYDETSDELWLHQRMHVQGPFGHEDEVIIDDADGGSIRSTECGDYPIRAVRGIERCIDRHHYRCTVAAYSMAYGVLPSEAQRRLDRVPEMEMVLASLRTLESTRTAGWDIDALDWYFVDRSVAGTGVLPRPDEPFVAWLWLTGQEPPNPAAAALAAQHHDVEIRTGAAVTHAALIAAYEAFDNGRGVSLLLEAADGGQRRWELAEMLAKTWVDHRANRLSIVVDPTRMARTDAWALLGVHTGKGFPPDDAELFAKLEQELRPLIEVPFAVVRGQMVAEEYD